MESKPSRHRQSSARRLSNRRSTYRMLVAIPMSIVVAGLAIPLIFGQPPDDTTLVAPTPIDVGADSSADVPLTSDAGGEQGGQGSREEDPVADDAPASVGGAAAPGRTEGSARSALTATDVGVSAGVIRIGFMLLTVSNYGPVGVPIPGVDPEQQRAAYEAQLAELNGRGGIHGRKVEGVYERFDVLSQDDQRRACLALREKKVFAVVSGAGGIYGPAVLCITEEGGTPFVNNGGAGTPTEYVTRSRGLLFTMYPISDRVMGHWVTEIDRLGLLRGKRIGILYTDAVDPSGGVIRGELVPALGRANHRPTHISRLSADQSTASTQVPIEVRQMQSKGVEVVLLASDLLSTTQFVQAADHQGFRPQYTFTDWGGINNDTANQNMPESYDGTIGITTYRTGEERVGGAETEPERACRAIYERGTGRKLGPRGSNENGLILGSCTTLLATTSGLEKSGPHLTRAIFSKAMQELGSFPMSRWGGGSFSPGKFGAADLVRPIRWFADCRCLKPVGDFRISHL